jgi:osmoprotectant transport system substrate-binding protein
MVKRRLLTLLCVALGLAGAAPVSVAADLVVGGKNFTEQLLMAEMTARLLQAKGYDVDKRVGLGSVVLRQAQEAGQIDVYWEYTGTSLITYNKVKERLSPAETYRRVKELDARKGLVWLNPSRANNTYALAMQADEAEHKGIQTISDLAKAVNADKQLTFACNAEFYARPDGLKPLQKAYGFNFGRDNIKRMDSGLTYQALKQGQVDVALVFATDGRIPAFNFTVLRDDKHYFPNYALAPVVRQEVLDANPELAALLNALSATLDDATLARLNAQVDVERKTIEAVAEHFLKEQGLL